MNLHRLLIHNFEVDSNHSFINMTRRTISGSLEVIVLLLSLREDPDIVLRVMLMNE